MEIFIGSSKESIQQAERVKLILEKLGHNPRIWPEEFPPAQYTFETLNSISNEVDAAVFVLASDDAIIHKGKEVTAIRDNVLIEAGLFYGKQRQSNVCLCVHNGPHIPTDWLGITRVDLDKQVEIVEKQLHDWLKKVKQRHSGGVNNVFFSSREEVEALCPLDARYSKNLILHIKNLRVLNLAATSLLTPELIDHTMTPSRELAQMVEFILENGASVEIIITAPGTPAMKHAKRKVANSKTAQNQEALFYGSYAKIQEIIQEDTVFKRAYNDKENSKRFNYYVTDISLPYGIFQVEYKDGYAHLDHIKIDLYSAELDNEKNRRSMFIWKDENPDNYTFFERNYCTIRNYCGNKMGKFEQNNREKWLKKWVELKRDLGL